MMVYVKPLREYYITLCLKDPGSISIYLMIQKPLAPFLCLQCHVATLIGYHSSLPLRQQLLSTELKLSVYQVYNLNLDNIFEKYYTLLLATSLSAYRQQPHHRINTWLYIAKYQQLNTYQLWLNISKSIHFLLGIKCPQ